MADSGAWDAGWVLGSNLAATRTAHKQAMSDREFMDKHDEIQGMIENLQTRIPTLPEGSKDRLEAHDQLAQLMQQRDELWHPSKNPGALQKFGKLLGKDLHFPQKATPPAAGPPIYEQPTITIPNDEQLSVRDERTMAVPSPKGLVEEGNLPIWNRPTIQNDDGTHSSEYSVSYADDKGVEVLVPTVVNGRFLTPDGKKPPEGSPAEQAMFKAAWQHYLQTGENLGKFDNPNDADAYAQVLHNRGSSLAGIKEQGRALQGAQPAAGTTIPTGPAYKVQGPQTPQQVRAQAEALQLEKAAPLSPEEQAEEKRRISEGDQQAQVDTRMATFHKLFPNASEEQTNQYKNLLTETMLGIKPNQQLGKWDRLTGKVKGSPITLLYNEKSGEYKTVEGDNVPDDVLQDFVPDPKEVKPGTSKFSVNVDSYKKLHGIPADQDLTPEELNFVEQQIALSSAAPSSNITNTLKQDLNGAWVPIQETTERIPGFGVILRDPLGPVENKGASPTSTGGAAPTPAEVKKKAEAINPTSPRSHGGVSVGTPLFQGPYAPFTQAQKDYATAVGLAEAAHTAEKADASVKAGLQREIAGRLQNTLEKRFNLQAMDNLINHYGIANNFATWLTRTETGALPDNVFHEVVAMADNNVVEKQAALKAATPPPIGAAKTYKHYATGPKQHKIGTDDDPNSPAAKWFDVKTGKPI